MMNEPGAFTRLELLGELTRIFERDFGGVGVEILEDLNLFTDLGLDSLQLTELLLVFEEEFGIVLDEAKVLESGTVGGALDAVADQISGRCAPA
jgi:acyl carrier protein